MTAARPYESEREEAASLFDRLPDPGAREELVREHRPLAEYLARRFRGRGESLDDLLQVASLGLIKAVDRFDPRRDIKFTTYATATIVGELKRHFRDRGWTVKVPRRVQEARLQVGRAVSELSQELARSPTVSEIARRAALTEEEVVEAISAASAYSPHSLHRPTDEEDEAGSRLLDRIGQEDASLSVVEHWVTVAPLLETLPHREQRLLYLRFYQGLTQREIADVLGISQMHVSRLLSQTLRQLRERAGG